MSFSPNSFLSNINQKNGLAKPSRFEVILPLPTYINSFIRNTVAEKLLTNPSTSYTDINGLLENVFGSRGSTSNEYSNIANASISRYLALQCESTELPGRTFQTADVKIYGPTFKVPYQSQFSDITLNFICTSEFYERKLFERWIEAIHPLDTNNFRYAKDPNSRYVTDIKIIQYDDFIKQIFAVQLLDAFPIGIAPQQLSWGEDGFHRLSVQFSFQKYRVIYDGTANLQNVAEALAATVFSPRIPPL